MRKKDIIVATIELIDGMSVTIFEDRLEITSSVHHYLNTFQGLATAMNLKAEYKTDRPRVIIYLFIPYSKA
jgi:hypothetical protein